ncbi:MAG TPA: glutamine amidotransferase [Candidatus Limnocylindrales bacterium]|nr:glutamine amidotransferase [Candidatus Limnocylindrales bacterium]
MSDLYLIGVLPLWLIALVGVAAAALLAQQFINLRQRLPLGQTAFLTLLRACVYAGLIFFLLGPALIDKRVTKLRRPLTLLVDTSQSMSFPASAKSAAGDKAAKSRLDLVKEKLEAGPEPLIQRLNRDYDLRVIRFGTGLESIAPGSLERLRAQDPGTRLIELLQRAARDGAARSGIVVFSDGITNGEMKSLDGAAIAAPVFTVGVGETEGFTDVRIAKLGAPEFAFRGREFKIDLTLQAFGMKGKSVPLFFNRGKNLITTRAIAIDADPFEQKVTLSFTPKELGTHAFSVSLPVQPGEQISQNNQKEFKVEVRRDKIRVLTLSGSPAWNYRFLRMAMKQDPLIELVSFVFLRTPTDTVDVPENQLSLIPFPIDDIFLEELKNFDVVVLDDFSHRAYFNPVYLERVRDFVRDGGGLAMFGGSRAFDSGGYGDSALRDVLPVELDGKGSYQSRGPVHAALTAAGKKHPITRLLPDPKVNEETWSKLPALSGLNQVHSVRGETLLTATGEGSQTGAPLLAIGRFGKGRTLALMTDDAWRWNFIAVGNKETPQNHLKLIRQAVRWLAQEPAFEQVQLYPIPTAQPAEKVMIKLKVLNDDFTPTRQASVQLRVFSPEGEPTLVSTGPDSEEGEYSGEFIPTREGTYRVEAEANAGGKPLGRDKASFTAAFSYGETDDGLPRLDLLKQIAESSKGEYISINDWNEKTFDKIAARLETIAPSEIVEQRQTRLWSNLWPFGLILALLSVEWWMRRKWGLI